MGEDGAPNNKEILTSGVLLCEKYVSIKASNFIELYGGRQDCYTRE